MKEKICLISPGHIASNPRLVKEANALHAEGYRVTVIAGDITSRVRPLDKTILAKAPWSYKTVNFGRKAQYIALKLRQKWAQNALRYGYPVNLQMASWAHNLLCNRLVQAAISEPAELYIAHYIAALPAAAIAARRFNTNFGFDAEDYHIGELTDIPTNKTEIRARDYIERTLLPFAVHLTASSPLIAKAYSDRYGVKMRTILNVFPLDEAPSQCVQTQPNAAERDYFSLYWFSQTAGLGRGLEEIIQIISKVRVPIQLIIRGSKSGDPGAIEQLISMAVEAGIINHVQFLPKAPPADMARLAACYDLGLSVEPGKDDNNKICLGNKIFTYLLAGIPVLLSRTPAQEQLAKELGEAALLVDLYRPEESAHRIDRFLSDPTRLVSARNKAWQLAQERYNWDLEQQQFLSIMEQNLNQVKASYGSR